MSKQILPNELAEIVTGLLVCPDAFNELSVPEKHMAFMADIGRVVCEHCGVSMTCCRSLIVTTIILYHL